MTVQLESQRTPTASPELIESVESAFVVDLPPELASDAALLARVLEIRAEQAAQAPRAPATVANDPNQISHTFTRADIAPPEEPAAREKRGWLSSKLLNTKVALYGAAIAVGTGVAVNGPSEKFVQKLADNPDMGSFKIFMHQMGSQPIHSTLLAYRLYGAASGGHTAGAEHIQHLPVHAQTMAAVTHSAMHAQVKPPKELGSMQLLADTQKSSSNNNQNTHFASATPVVEHGPRDWVANPDQYNMQVNKGANGSDQISIAMNHYKGDQPLYTLVTGKDGAQVKIPLTEHLGSNGERIYSAEIGKSGLASTLNGHHYKEIEVREGNTIVRSTAFGDDTGKVGAYNSQNNDANSGLSGFDVSKHTPAADGQKEYTITYQGGTAVVELPQGDSADIGTNLSDFIMNGVDHLKMPVADFNSMNLHNRIGDLNAINGQLSQYQQDILRILHENGDLYKITREQGGNGFLHWFEHHDDDDIDYGVLAVLALGAIAAAIILARRRSEEEEEEEDEDDHTTPPTDDHATTRRTADNGRTRTYDEPSRSQDDRPLAPRVDYPWGTSEYEPAGRDRDEDEDEDEDEDRPAGDSSPSPFIPDIRQPRTGRRRSGSGVARARRTAAGVVGSKISGVVSGTASAAVAAYKTAFRGRTPQERQDYVDRPARASARRQPVPSPAATAEQSSAASALQPNLLPDEVSAPWDRRAYETAAGGQSEETVYHPDFAEDLSSGPNRIDLPTSWGVDSPAGLGENVAEERSDTSDGATSESRQEEAEEALRRRRARNPDLSYDPDDL
jgi:hypothetical protein